MQNVFNLHKIISRIRVIQAKQAFKKQYYKMSNGIIDFDIIKLSSTLSKLKPDEQVLVLAESGLNQEQILYVMLNYDLSVNEILQILEDKGL